MEPSLPCAALSALVAGQESVTVLDVRRRPAFETDPRLIPGAVWKDPDQVTNWAAELNREGSIVVYCVHGHEVSHGAVDRLRALGFQAALLEGGIEAWKASGRPVIDSSGGVRSMKWVTRERPKIDRIACPWLIARFIDDQAEFLYVPPDQVLDVAKETGAIPYDVPGVELSHVGELCSFDAFLHKYELDEPALHELAIIVRGADTGRLDLAPQAPGLRAISVGLSTMFEDDHEMLSHGMVIYDALYAWLTEAREQPSGWPPEMAHTDAGVNEASEESFPASDPPSYTPVSGTGTPGRERH